MTAQRFKTIDELRAAFGRGEFNGKKISAVIEHDDECRMDPCSCSPSVLVEPLTDDALQRAMLRQEEAVDRVRKRGN